MGDRGALVSDPRRVLALELFGDKSAHPAGALEVAGGVKVIDVGASYRLENGGAEPAEIVLVEVR